MNPKHILCFVCCAVAIFTDAKLFLRNSIFHNMNTICWFHAYWAVHWIGNLQRWICGGKNIFFLWQRVCAVPGRVRPFIWQTHAGGEPTVSLRRGARNTRLWSSTSRNPVSYTHLDVYKRQVIIIDMADVIITQCRPTRTLNDGVAIIIFVHVHYSIELKQWRSQ